MDATRLIREVTTNPNGVHKSEAVNNVNGTQRTTRNSNSCTLDRLHRERPDLYAEVRAGGMSANCATIEAGFRRPTKTVYAVGAADGVRTLLRKTCRMHEAKLDEWRSA